MKNLLTDLLILAFISAFVACVMFLPRKTKCRLEKNWGVVLYDAPVTKDEATNVLNTLVESGTFDGNKQQTHTLNCVTEKGQRTLVWSMMTDQNFASRVADLFMQTGLHQVHAAVFSNGRVLVEIADEVVAESDETEQINADWGSVLYDPSIQKQDAVRVAQAITGGGGYNGTIRMTPEGRNIKYVVERDPAIPEVAKASVASQMQDLVLQTFPEERVRVLLVDEKLQRLKKTDGSGLMDPLLEPLEGVTESIKRKK